MTFSWTTFLFEIVNFLVLVWVLHRLLYRPILRVIRRRKEAVEQVLAEAHATRSAAESLEAQYRHRLDDWAAEKQQAQLKLHEELESERQRRLEALRSEVGQEREKANVIEARRLREITRNAENEALGHATGFAARLLERLASPALEAELVGILLEDLTRLDADRREKFGRVLRHNDEPVRVESAFPLTPALQQAIGQALSTLAGCQVACDFTQVAEVLAGVRVVLGQWVLSANLGDELSFFHRYATELGHELGQEPSGSSAAEPSPVTGPTN
ncbi:MAG: F0F1 ATP synthase subunit delta [Candidatus Lambdaproteobacteria bacterium]|nr:F0F1 ATP synthase subunit delta [Candidatus Lambdaproteobacteria bacterium]